MHQVLLIPRSPEGKFSSCWCTHTTKALPGAICSQLWVEGVKGKGCFLCGCWSELSSMSHCWVHLGEVNAGQVLLAISDWKAESRWWGLHYSLPGVETLCTTVKSLMPVRTLIHTHIPNELPLHQHLSVVPICFGIETVTPGHWTCDYIFLAY